VTIRELVSAGLLEISTGDEVGKLAYGTGNIPFIRTSDLSNWEIKIDPKHCISEELYKKFANKQDVQANDILMVKDGTYLIGDCAFITEYDTHIVYQSHIYKLRITDHLKISPYLLLAIISSAPVQRQIKSKRFTHDIIDSLGDRIYELVIPIPKNPELCERVSRIVEKAIQDRIEARELARKACAEVIEQISL
jgi:type I restriction enzyme M protein